MEKRGQVNLYVCQTTCKRRAATINLSTGVTPFSMPCDNPRCDGWMASSMYRLPAGEYTVRYAYYRPRYDEFVELLVDVQEHVLEGGLISAPLASARPLADDPNVDVWLDPSIRDVDRWLSYVAAAYKPRLKLFRRVEQRLRGGDP